MLEHPRAQKWISLSSLTPVIISPKWLFLILPKISSTLDFYFQLPLDIPLGGLKGIPNLNCPKLSFCYWCHTDSSYNISKLCKLLLWPKLLFCSCPTSNPSCRLCFQQIQRICLYLTTSPTSQPSHSPSLTWMTARASYEVSVLLLLPTLCPFLTQQLGRAF